MSIRINRERLAATFVELCEIDSPSRREKRVADYLKKRFQELGADKIIEDQSANETGSNCGNLIVSFPGKKNSKEAIFFVCHMDTVEPGSGVQVVRHGDIFTSRGDTILGGDDKSGIAALLEVVQVIKENKSDCRPFEIVLTTCEEIGLLGAKALEYENLHAQFGYALDSTGIDRVIVGAPAANRLQITVNGIAAHAGLEPEQGISALTLAAEAIARLSLGRLDEQSTANLGLIEGGTATNIIPEKVVIEGEVRSHSIEKLEKYTETIKETFRQIVSGRQRREVNGDMRPSVTVKQWEEYPLMAFNDEHPVVSHVRQAGVNLGREMTFEIAGGGSDANILNSYGLPTAIIATGMNKVHTTDESMDVGDLVKLAELIYELIKD